ncbi:glycerophosphodiester phosphodiesterase GDPD1, chloroplastic [Eucalyptus grandis]|uniref:glycerophosphodiester phosphodiesterase GDPD1, chloroplastic n=1 Tax=Eucalyptus grandis TaxID=71139 RepID=UPI00192F0F5A|nr:glycerophosphodiester phosphodiesterase GDPD1, chloroplastic [Eucalyptus grandis]
MALKAVHVSDVPSLDRVPETAALDLSSQSRFLREANKVDDEPKKMLVIGHRGSGMNVVQSSDGRMRAIRENSIRSFNAAAAFPVDFVEFDVQVTKDDCPVIFHDNFILSELKGGIIEKRVTDLNLDEFLSYGPQDSPEEVGKPLFRKTKDGRIFEWKVENDAPLCTLQEAFKKVDPLIGFNIELKFDDQIEYKEEELTCVLQVILKVVSNYAKDRPILFSSFQPDAAILIRKLQSTYPVFFLTNGGTEIYKDVRRNSLDEAIKVCLAGGLQGIVSQVKAIFRNPCAINRIKESSLSLITYGQLNNVAEVVYMQYLMGIEGVIVDFIPEITEAISDIMGPAKEGKGETASVEEAKAKPHFSQHELSFLLKLIPELIKS